VGTEPTIRDVATRAGTSTAVVSYVLNDGPRPVAADTRARVLAAVAALGYRRNNSARALRANRTGTLGLVVPDLGKPFFAELARAIENAAFARGRRLLVGSAHFDADHEYEQLRALLDARVDAVLLVPSQEPARALALLRGAGLPYALVHRTHPEAVGIAGDDIDAGRQAAAHLIEHGYRQVAMLGALGGPGGLGAPESLGALGGPGGLGAPESLGGPGGPGGLSGSRGPGGLGGGPGDRGGPGGSGGLGGPGGPGGSVGSGGPRGLGGPGGPGGFGGLGDLGGEDPVSRRTRGALATFADHGRPVLPHHVLTCGFTDLRADAYRATRELFADGQPIDAICAATDEHALGAMRAATEAGRRIGVDLALVSIDGTELGAYLSPALTTVATPFAALGADAVDTVLGSGDIVPTSRLHPVTLTVRRTCGCRDPQGSG
jgi:DNA-binding LacI/PurR family transcriptional regulator